jgi:phage repressor protein C with HTH and peptisase S24 domain
MAAAERAPRHSAAKLVHRDGLRAINAALFNPGDPLLVDRGITRVDVDAVYFFRIGEEGFIKQVQRLYVGEVLTLRAKSYNQMYDPFDIPQNGEFEVFGRVVKVWKGEEF